MRHPVRMETDRTRAIMSMVGTKPPYRTARRSRGAGVDDRATPPPPTGDRALAPVLGAKCPGRRLAFTLPARMGCGGTCWELEGKEESTGGGRQGKGGGRRALRPGVRISIPLPHSTIAPRIAGRLSRPARSPPLKEQG